MKTPCKDCGIPCEEGYCPECEHRFPVHELHDVCPNCGFSGAEIEFIFD